MSNIEEDRYRSTPKDFLHDTNNSHKRKSLKEQDEYEVVKQFIDLNDNKKNMLHNYKANLFLNANISSSPTNHADNYYKSPLKDKEKKNNDVRNISIPQNKIPVMHYQMYNEGLDTIVESPLTDQQRRQLTLIRKKTPSCPRPQNKEHEHKNMFRKENKVEANQYTSHDVHKNEYKNTNADINITLKNSRNNTNQTLQHEKQKNDVQIVPRRAFNGPIPSEVHAMNFNADKSIYLKYTDSPKNVYTECFAKAQPRINYTLEKQNSKNMNYCEKDPPYMHIQKPDVINSTHSSHMIRNVSNPSKVYHSNNKVEIVRNRSTPDNPKNVTTIVNLSNLENAYDVYHTNNLNNVIIVKNVIQISNPNKSQTEKEVRKLNESYPSSINRTLSNSNELKPVHNKNTVRNVSSPSKCHSHIDSRNNVSEYTNYNRLHMKMKEDSNYSSHTTAGLKRMSSSVDAIKYKIKDSGISQLNLRSRYNSGENYEILIKNREYENTKRESVKDIDEIELDSSRRGSEEEIKIKEIMKTDRMLNTYKEHMINIKEKNKREFSREKGEKKEVTQYDESYRGREINTNNEKIKEESSAYINSDQNISYNVHKNVYNLDERPIVVSKEPDHYGYPMGNPYDSEQIGRGENKHKRTSCKLQYGRNKVESFVDINGNVVHMFPDEKKLRASTDSSVMGEEEEEYIEYTQIKEEREQMNRRNKIAETRKIKEIEKIERELKTERIDVKKERGGHPADLSEINIDYNSEDANLKNILKKVEKENKIKNSQTPKKRLINISDHDKYKNMKEGYEEKDEVTDTKEIIHESSKWKETSNNSSNPNKNIHSTGITTTKGNHGMMNDSTNSYTSHRNDDHMNNSINQSSSTPHGIRKIVPIPSKHKGDKVNYINYHELSDFPNVITAEYRNVLVNDLIEKSKDQEWTKQIEYMIDLRKVLKYYSKPFFEEHSKDLRRIVRVLVEFLNSPRSCVSKNSLLCLMEFYSVGMKKTDCTIEDVILPCLKKAHQTSVDFINSAANNTLLAICSACTESKLIQQFIKIMTSKTKTFNLLCLRYLISVLLKYDENVIKYKEVNKVVEAIFECTNGGSAEIKCTARVALVVLENICPIKKLCGKQISSEMLRKIEVLMNKTTDEDINTVLGKITVH